MTECEFCGKEEKSQYCCKNSTPRLIIKEKPLPETKWGTPEPVSKKNKKYKYIQ